MILYTNIWKGFKAFCRVSLFIGCLNVVLNEFKIVLHTFRHQKNTAIYYSLIKLNLHLDE